MTRQLNEQGVPSVSRVLVTDIFTSFTREGPPQSAIGDPARISLVIIGTIILFVLGSACVGFIATCPQRHAQTLHTVTNKAQLAFDLVTPNSVRTKMRQSQGFRLANSEDDRDNEHHGLTTLSSLHVGDGGSNHEMVTVELGSLTRMSPTKEQSQRK
jgi:hypothetical protein